MESASWRSPLKSEKMTRISFDKLSEKQFRDYDKAGVVSALRLVKSDEGYLVVVQLTWRSGESVIFSQRNQPKAWVSLDRLIAHLREAAPSISKIALDLTPVEPGLAGF